MNDLIATFTERGDLAHLALFLWASMASAFCWFALRELAAASRRFDDFVRELARFNDIFRNDIARVPGAVQRKTLRRRPGTPVS